MRDAEAAATMIATHLLASRLKVTGEGADEKNVARCFDAAELVIAEAFRRSDRLRKMEDEHHARLDAARDAARGNPLPMQTPPMSSGAP